VGFRCRNSCTYASADFERVVRSLPPSEGHPRPPGEGLPFLLPRVESRLRHASPDLRGRQLKPVTFYLRENFYLTTAGAFRTQALIDTLLEVGSDHVLFLVDYPYETMQEQSDWFESVPISEADRLKIGRANAQQLLRLGS
jgi:gamma-resorcylate decarboxylase